MNPNHILKVRNVITPVAYASIEGAIRGALAQNGARESVNVSEAVTGGIITSVDWSDTWVILRLSNGKMVTITNAGNTLNWRVEQHDDAETRQTVAAPRQVMLQFPSQAEAFVWRRAELLERRKEKTFVTLFSSDFGLFLYVLDTPTLLFAPLEILDEGGSLLYWDECE